MGFRFSRRIKIAPGVRLNLGLRGVSVFAGVRGANMTLGRHGLHGNVGLPGTGLSYRTKLAAGQARAKARSPAPAPPPPEMVRLRFDGADLRLLDERGFDLPPERAEAARRAHRAAISEALRERAEALNAFTVRQLDVHLDTPVPSSGLSNFTAPKPVAPAPNTDGGRNEQLWGEYMSALAEWRAHKAEHERRRPAPQSESMASFTLEQALERLIWPRETVVSFAFGDDGRILRLDVDLPEFEDLPEAEAQADLRALTLCERALTAAARRRAYARHVHAVVFRLIGEAFAALDGVDRVLVAGYTQRVSAATGREEDEYLLEVEAGRPDWSMIAFDALDQVDPQVALARFRLRRDLSRANELRTITPPVWAAP